MYLNCFAVPSKKKNFNNLMIKGPILQFFFYIYRKLKSYIIVTFLFLNLKHDIKNQNKNRYLNENIVIPIRFLIALIFQNYCFFFIQYFLTPGPIYTKKKN